MIPNLNQNRKTTDPGYKDGDIVRMDYRLFCAIASLLSLTSVKGISKNEAWGRHAMEKTFRSLFVGPALGNGEKSSLLLFKEKKNP